MMARFGEVLHAEADSNTGRAFLAVDRTVGSIPAWRAGGTAGPGSVGSELKALSRRRAQLVQRQSRSLRISTNRPGGTFAAARDGLASSICTAPDASVLIRVTAVGLVQVHVATLAHRPWLV